MPQRDLHQLPALPLFFSRGHSPQHHSSLSFPYLNLQHTISLNSVKAHGKGVAGGCSLTLWLGLLKIPNCPSSPQAVKSFSLYWSIADSSSPFFLGRLIMFWILIHLDFLCPQLSGGFLGNCHSLASSPFSLLQWKQRLPFATCDILTERGSLSHPFWWQKTDLEQINNFHKVYNEEERRKKKKKKNCNLNLYFLTPSLGVFCLHKGVPCTDNR